MNVDISHRKEGIQRIRTGLAGLTGVVLLVGLANIVVDSVKRDDATQESASTDPVANATVPLPLDEKPTEPLAELGVTPASSTESQASQPPVVADLQPDPNLKQPMDRPPPENGKGPVPSQPPPSPSR